MKGKDYVVLILTFVTGVFAGSYLYTTSFAPSYQEDEVPSTQEVMFLLQGQKRGDCNRDGDLCPSFELRANRTYSYIPQYLDGVEPEEVVHGKLGKDRFDELLAYVDAIDLMELEKKSPGACSNIYDTNYAYNLVYKGQSYTYDTCNTAFKNSVLATKFYPLWTRLATTTPTAPLLEEGLSGFLRNQLDKRFTYDD